MNWLRIFKHAFFVLFFSLFGCGSRELKAPVLATYSSIQQNIISQKCLMCHSSLSTYNGVLITISPGNPSQSRFYKVIQDGSMPQWSPSLSGPEIQAVSTWILNGAAND